MWSTLRPCSPAAAWIITAGLESVPCGFPLHTPLFLSSHNLTLTFLLLIKASWPFYRAVTVGCLWEWFSCFFLWRKLAWFETRTALQTNRQPCFDYDCAVKLFRSQTMSIARAGHCLTFSVVRQTLLYVCMCWNEADVDAEHICSVCLCSASVWEGGLLHSAFHALPGAGIPLQERRYVPPSFALMKFCALLSTFHGCFTRN